ncbi:MAG: ribbon-helix-helix domain-containing protein [Candidatus Bathyarchaeia archaeon]
MLFTALQQNISKEGYKTRLITLHLPEPYIKALDKLVNEKFYPNRAEAIRVAVRDLLNVEAWGRGKSNA